MRKKNKAGRLTLSDFRICYKATAFKIAWYWQKDRYTYQKNRRENPEINSYVYPYHQMIFTKGANATQWRKDTFFNKYNPKQNQYKAARE